MAELFIRALLGHLIGDYLLQPKNMAVGKSVSSWKGTGKCTLHALIYTAAVCLMLWTSSPAVWTLVLVPHWAIDRWSLATGWLRLIKGRTLETAYSSRDMFREFDIAFTALVYAVVDNTFHLLCLWLVIKFFLV